MASGNMKDIRRRIKSVQSTMQITKAMELVASSKMRRAKERVEHTRNYFRALHDSFTQIAADSKTGDSIYLTERPVGRSLFVVIAGDRGLAGGYNANVLKLALQQMEGKNPLIVAVGHKANEFFAKRGFEIAAKYINVAENLQIKETQEMVEAIIRDYRAKKIDEVFLCYTNFVSPMTQTAVCARLLPVSRKSNTVSTSAHKKSVLIEYDPSPEVVLNAIIPEYLSGMLYGAIVESYASETAARRLAMESASDNANEMIGQLELSYNRARQANITQEITEIVAGSGQLG